LKTYEGDFSDLCLNFSIDEEDPMSGKKRPVELEYDGCQKPVTKENVFRYVYLVMDYKINK